MGILCGAILLASAPAFAQGAAAAPAPAAPAAPAAAAGPTDPQIAAIVVAANQVDIDAAKLAKPHTKNPAVKEFAETMIRDHSAVNKQAVALVKKLKVKPEANDTSKSLIEGGKKTNAELKKLKGVAFDKAYVDHEVAYHQQVIDAINNVLIPNAKNAELKDMLVKVTPAFQAHLDHAKKLQAELAAAPAK